MTQPRWPGLLVVSLLLVGCSTGPGKGVDRASCARFRTEFRGDARLVGAAIGPVWHGSTDPSAVEKAMSAFEVARQNASVTAARASGRVRTAIAIYAHDLGLVVASLRAGGGYSHETDRRIGRDLGAITKACR